MSYLPGYSDVPPPMVQAGVSPWTAGYSVGSWVSAGWEAANRGVYLHLRIPVLCIARRLWWANGAVVSSSYTVEMAIYADSGNVPGSRIVATGSVAQGAATQVQFVAVTPTTIPPGSYWLFLSASSTSATIGQTTSLTAPIQKLYKYQQASVAPGSAPATATPAVAASARMPNFGFSTTD